jgi:hypothetical protein
MSISRGGIVYKILTTCLYVIRFFVFLHITYYSVGITTEIELSQCKLSKYRGEKKSLLGVKQLEKKLKLLEWSTKNLQFASNKS